MILSMEQYWTQPQPVRLPIGSVEVSESDIQISYPVTINRALKIFGKIIVLKSISHFSYLVVTGEEPVLWTMDDYGNKKSPSVF
jgi:hypothetical protein